MMIDRRYEVLRELGAGGMAEVFLAKQKGEGGFEKLVVVKRILKHLSQHEEFVAMFYDEARSAADLRHSNIVTLFEVGSDDGAPFIAMEYLHGCDLRKIQKKLAERDAVFSISGSAQIAIDAARGLAYAHRKKDLLGKDLEIVHRDISPHNVMVTYEGTTKILDFGIAKAASRQTQTRTGIVKGKYAYMSPEQAAGDDIDGRTDQFALGIVFWEMLTMRRLFARDDEHKTRKAIFDSTIPPPSTYNSAVPTALDDVVMRMLHRVRFSRFESLDTAAKAIEEVMAQSSIRHSQQLLSQELKALMGAEAKVQMSGVLKVQAPEVNALDATKISESKKAKVSQEVAPSATVASKARDKEKSLSADSTKAALDLAEHLGHARSTPWLLLALLTLVIGAGAYFVFKDSSSTGDVTQNASVEIVSKPSGARVYWNGANTDKFTPARFDDVPLNTTIAIRLEKPKYNVLRTSVNLSKPGHLLVEEKLIPFGINKDKGHAP